MGAVKFKLIVLEVKGNAATMEGAMRAVSQLLEEALRPEGPEPETAIAEVPEPEPHAEAPPPASSPESADPPTVDAPALPHPIAGDPAPAARAEVPAKDLPGAYPDGQYARRRRGPGKKRDTPAVTPPPPPPLQKGESGNGPVEGMIEDALRKRPLTSQELLATLKTLNPGTIYDRLAKMRNEGRVQMKVDPADGMKRNFLAIPAPNGDQPINCA